MCPTPTGRIHTRTATFVLPLIFSGILSIATSNIDWLVLLGVYYLLAVFLDAGVYSWAIKYQPPWVGIVLALVEFGLLLVLAGILHQKTGGLSISVVNAIWFFWANWVLASLTKIVFLPIASLTYLESAGEFRTTEWSVPPPLQALPVLASSAEAKAGPGPVIREASGVHARPLEPLPSPSGIHRTVQQPAG